MVEYNTEKKIESLHKSEGGDLEELLYRLLIQKSDLLYFICRRGSWIHTKQRGKEVPPFDPRGILKDREIDCKNLANNPLNTVSKNTFLIKVILRKDWKKSMHSMPAIHCALDNYGKKFYKYLLRNKMVKFIEDNYSIENFEDFFNAFNNNFKLPLTEDDLRRYEEENLTERSNRRISVPKQEEIIDVPLNDSDYEENSNFRVGNDENNYSSIPISSEKSKLVHDIIIEFEHISKEQALGLLSIEDQTILDIINNNRIVSRWFTIALLAKLNELVSLKLIEDGLKNGKKAWRLKNFKLII